MMIDATLKFGSCTVFLQLKLKFMQFEVTNCCPFWWLIELTDLITYWSGWYNVFVIDCSLASLTSITSVNFVSTPIRLGLNLTPSYNACFR